jgi:serine/threonine protein kinase
MGSLSKKYNNLIKRFETEFKKIAKIGTGGFSSVYKVMNILDNSFYAIKKIKIKIEKKNKDLQKEIISVLQEIRYLAKIKSEYIVTYNHSWVEIKIKVLEESEDNNYIDYNYNNSVDDIEFFGESHKSDSADFQTTTTDNKSSEDFISVNGKVYTLDMIDSINIFIQMELCKDTLYDIIERRSHKNDYYQESLLLFEKILSGVEYIHKENLIHRDLKPKNIFFTYTGDIKIGDLGLATESLNKKCAMECPSPIERSFDMDINSEEDLAEELSFHLEIEESKCEEIHTSNIGTIQYAAPEQLNNVHYDKKVDIYSLGLILLELVYPFKTRMERQEVYHNLKNKKHLNQEFCKKYPDISDIILNMTESDPCKRPDVVLLKSQITALIIKLTSPKKLDFKLRKRFLSEDICSIKPYEFNLKLAESAEWKKW